MTKLTIGEFVPVMKPVYKSFEDTIEEQGITGVETKHDGDNIQVHRKSGFLRIFTSSGKELNYACYPDVVEIAQRLPTGIFMPEMKAMYKNHKKCFDAVASRRRRNGISQKAVEAFIQSGQIEKIPLHLMLYDVLKYGNTTILDLPQSERRTFVEKINEPGIEIADRQLVNNVLDLERILHERLDSGDEGIVCKDPKSPYVPGGPSEYWVKYKRSEPLDVVVVGLYMSNGMDIPELGLPTAALCATRNTETGLYETIGKVSLRRENHAKEVWGYVKDKIQQEKPESLLLHPKIHTKSYMRFLPNCYVNPEQSTVIQIKAMNLNHTKNWQSCGLDNEGKSYSMRIGFYQCSRDYDKTVYMATTSQAVGTLFALQEKLGMTK